MFRDKAVVTGFIDGILAIVILTIGQFAPEYAEFSVQLAAAIQVPLITMIVYFANEPGKGFIARSR